MVSRAQRITEARLHEALGLLQSLLSDTAIADDAAYDPPRSGDGVRVHRSGHSDPTVAAVLDERAARARTSLRDARRLIGEALLDLRGAHRLARKAAGRTDGSVVIEAHDVLTEREAATLSHRRRRT